MGGKGHGLSEPFGSSSVSLQLLEPKEEGEALHILRTACYQVSCCTECWLRLDTCVTAVKAGKARVQGPTPNPRKEV